MSVSSPVWGQVVNPVYVDDAPAARDTLLRVRDHLAAGNLGEAARVLQVMLDEMPDRLVPVGSSAGGKGVGGAAKDDGGAGAGAKHLFVSVRSESHRVLLGNAGLLERYRADFGATAREKLAAGGVAEVERSYLLTSAGFEAALRLAQRQMEDARFQAALLTLRQLEGHPDLTGQGKKDAGALAGQLARYLDTPGARKLAGIFGGEVGEATAWPASARIAGTTPLETATKADLGAVLGKPLRSVSISDDRLVPALLQAIRPIETERLPASARHLVILPTVADDTLYLNDGLQVSAWDRITLTPRWSVSGEMPSGEESIQAASNLRGSMRGNPVLQDPTTVAVSGRTAVAPLGLAVGSLRWPDERVVAMDTLTGKVRWAVAVEELDPVLANQKVRGPAVISEGTVVLALRASLPDKRMVTLYQAGLDLASGRLRWSRLLGSTGALPYRDDPYVSDAAQVVEGIVYHSDMLGVVSATEAGTGRPVWLRRMPPVAVQTWDPLNPWQIGSPIVLDEDVVVLSPDHRLLVRLDRRTGEVKGQVETQRFDQQAPRYVLRVGRQVAVVFDNRIALAPLDSFETASARLTPRFAQPGINGRVTAAGDKLLVPVAEGVMVVDAGNPEGEATLMPLDSPGNLLALESQLLVVDDTSVHSYLLWEVAEKLLTERMAEAPGDPTSATTLAELAYRAGKQDRIVPAADAALAALGRAKDPAEAEPTRERLFSSLASMVADAVEPSAGAGAGDAGTPRISAGALLADLVDRMGRAAKTPDERLTHALARGRLAEHRKAGREAVDIYQSVLDDEALATATWAGPRLSTRGELEVTRRLESLVEEQGVAVYAAHDAKSAREAAALPTDAPAEALVQLAMRYPVGGEASRLWERAATAYHASGRDHAVVGALESALHAAERIPGGPRVGEVAGRLIAELEARQQYAAAGNALKNVQERHAGVVVTIAGAPVDTKELASRLAHQVAARQRWPRVGEPAREGMQVLAGWALMEPMMRPRQPIAPRGVVMKSSDHVGLYLPSDTPGPGGASELALAWKRPIDTELFELIRLDSEAAYFFFATAKGAVIEKVSQAPAGLKWQTPLLADVPARTQARPGRPEMTARIPTPQDGLALLTDGVITMDDRTIVLLERQGFATALDTQSGAVLWTIRSPLDRVYDATVTGGSLVVAGDQEVVAGPGERVEDLRPEIVVLDARTGQEVQRLPQRWGGVRWVRMADSGQLVAGCENAIVCTDLSRGQVNWVLSDPHLSGSRDAWVFEDSVFVLDRDRRLWLANVRSGQVSPDALEAPRARLDGVRRIEAALIPPGIGNEGGAPLVAFSTYQGVLLYDLAGRLKGVDAVGGLDGLLPPVPASDRMLTITTMPEGRRDDRDLIYSIYELDTVSSMVMHTAPIVLTIPPRSIAVLDGRILVTSGGSSVVLPAPAAK
jgi:outer membrane protein assembly factor BamB